jgi:hypothetical protein
MALLVDPSNPGVAEITTNQMLAGRPARWDWSLHVLNASTVLRTRARERCD